MCTYIVERTEVNGSGKGPQGWFALTHANVMFDHPVHAQYDHCLTIDFVNEGMGPAARVAIELGADSARELVKKIVAALEAGEAQT